ncbi:hypothetical protein RJ640_024536 [Escallonia rubra]|uniref:Pentatricopeptide repeat-containing protein n=1 Tax=Escallonia rubra TaxID=112253 RepID=A0AA88R2E9_9ASTE|nr:hypothetical protein RJ640_024536 [Escallonia rubra]
MLGNNISPNIVSYSLLIDGLCKRELMDEALLAFHCALDIHLLPIQMTYGILIHGYCKVGRLSEALVFYNCRLEDGIMPDNCIQETLSMYKLLNCVATDSAFN